MIALLLIAQMEVEEVAVEERAIPVLQFDLGLKTAFVPHRFSNDDAHVEGGLGAAYTAWSNERFSIVPGARWEFANITGTLRGLHTNQMQQRFMATLDGRWHATPWMYVFVRAAPGAVYQTLNISADTASAWAPSFDASAGVAFLAVGHKAYGERRVRWWFAIDGGYSYVAPVTLRVLPSSPDGDSRASIAPDVGAVRLAAPFVRLATALTY